MQMISVPLGEQTLPRETLEQDKKNCRKIGSCGLGREALYVGSRFLSRWYYIPWREVHRVFKRVAMTPGGYSGRGLFSSMAYLVVQYGSGREKACPFKFENQLDELLRQVEREHPQLPTHSAQAEKKLAEAAEREKRRYAAKLSPEAEEAYAALQQAKTYLEKKPELSWELSSAAKQKRIADNLSPAILYAGTAAGILGILLALYGLYRLLAHSGAGMYFVAGGAILFFLVFSANLFPSRWNSRKYTAAQWEEAVERSRAYVSARKDFPVPPQYAHTIVLERMIRVIREGRAGSTSQALEIVKDDLRALNAEVKVSQEEHDEVVEIKPLFLVCDYRN